VTPAPSTTPLSDTEKIVHLEKQLQWAEWRIRALEERLRMEMIRKYGAKSEKLSDTQLNLLELEPGVSTEEVQAESEREPLPTPPLATSPESKKQRKHPGRQPLPAHLPRVEQIVPCTPEQCVCKACGNATAVIGYESSEQLDVKPAEYFVLVIQREKRACPACTEGGVKGATVSTKVTEVSKYCYHLPLYRQSAIRKRETCL
jgi:hypothetical protein